MGFTRTVLEDGTGHQPKKGDKVTVQYTGFLFDETNNCRGEPFGSSEGRDVPFTKTIGEGQVIRGCDEGIMEMKVGEKSILKISSDYAYGERGIPGLIPPDSTLEFDVRLLGINLAIEESTPEHEDTLAVQG